MAIDPEVLNQVKQAVAAMAGGKGVLTGTVNIERKGDKITLPDGMAIPEAITWLQRKQAEEETKVDFEHVVDAFPFEGAYALYNVLKDKYGYAAVQEAKSFFEPNPTMLSLESGVGETVTVPWAKFKVPGLSAVIGPHIVVKDGRLQFALVGETKRKDEEVVREIRDMVQRYIRERSLYRGKAVRIKFPNSPKEFNPLDCPKFLDVATADPRGLVFSEDLDRIVQTNLFTPIEHRDDCVKYGVPLKRGILLEGPYGTGKTLAAHVTARKCIENGWTFLYLESVMQLAQAIQFARQYQPCVIFAEDIDRAVAGDERTTSIDAILNTIDGIDSKATQTMVILTTNNVNVINKAMLRPGRLDAVISFKAPDADAAVRLVQLYARDLLDEHDDFSRVGPMLAGQIPAFIREVVERSKLAAIGRLLPNEVLRLRARDIEVATDTLTRHLELLKEVEPDNRSDEEKAADRLGAHIRAGMHQHGMTTDAERRAIEADGQKGIGTSQITHAAIIAARTARAELERQEWARTRGELPNGNGNGHKDAASGSA